MRRLRALFHTTSGVLLVSSAGAMSALACSGSSNPDGGAGGAAGGQDGGGGSATGGTLTGGAPTGGGDTGGEGGIAPSGGAPGGGGGPFEACGPEPVPEVQGPFVPPEIVLDEPAPVPTGGELVDGNYDLASFVFYEDFPLESLAQDFRQVIRVRGGGTMMDAFSVARGNPAAWSYAVSEVEGPQMTITVTCPSIYVGVAQPQMYSASPGQLAVFIAHGSAIAVATHVLRE